MELNSLGSEFDPRLRTLVPCLDRQILNHWTTREVSKKWNFYGWSHPTVVLGVRALTNLRQRANQGLL